jgi:hypothetical protein
LNHALESLDVPLVIGHRRAHLAQILDLFGEDSWRNVHAGELEVRPPGAPTTGRWDGRFARSGCVRVLRIGSFLVTVFCRSFTAELLSSWTLQ